MEINISNVLSQFPFEGNLVSIEPVNEGWINTTVLVKFDKKQYIVQKINTAVFTKPDELMKNIVDVTGYLSDAIKASGGDPDRETLHFLKTLDGKLYYTDEDGSCWRSYVYVDDCYTLGSNCSLDEIYEAAKAFGHFQYMLGDFPGNKLFEIIDGFHHTPTRMERLKKAIAEDKVGRVCEAQEEINCLLEREKNCSVVTDLLAKGEIPIRVTHNDTKINNILFDNKTKKAICVIDLDTIMPGSSLYDFGDGIRTGATDGAEDDVDNIGLNIKSYEAYVKGFLEGANGKLVEKEIELLPFSAILLTQEVAIRFLTDYLEGDVYFKINYPDQNLVRTKAQLNLVKDMESKLERMNEITQSCK